MHRLIKILTISVFGFFLLILILSFLGVHLLSKKINTTPIHIFNTVKTALFNPSFSQQDKINLLILGLDKRDDWLEKTETTDTIILASLDINSGKVSMVSLPRDIWSYKLNAKINNIYPLSSQANDRNTFIKNEFSEITGFKIDRVLIITTSDLSKLADTIGGVDVYLENGFKDDRFPNPEYIKNPSPKTPVYKTVEFPSGWVHLDGKNISEFVRSRKGAETVQMGGTDIGRIKRQQALMENLLSKMKDPSSITDLNRITNLYAWFNDLQTDLTDTDLLSLALRLKDKLNRIDISKKEIPIGLTEKEGVIYHPEKFINKQWVYVVSGENYSNLKSFLSSTL